MKILFTTPVLGYPAAGGPQLRIENSIKALSRVSDLHIVSRVSRNLIGGPEAERFYGKYSRELVYTPSATFYRNRHLRKLQAYYRKITSHPDDFQFILEYIDKKGLEIIWFGFGNISFPLIRKIKEARPGIKVICDTDSVWSRYILRELPYESDPERRITIEKSGKEKEEEEGQWVNLCDITTAVSRIDAEYYMELADDPGKIKLFSNVIDLDTYKGRHSAPAEFKKPCIYLAGTFWSKSPMEKAARWFIEKVLPLLKRDIPNLHFYIIGKNSDTILKDINDEHITITGRLDSVLPYLCNSDVAIVPLMFESGTRFKILEAGACGIPIVSTALGAEGIPVTDGEDIIIADEPEKFAEAITKLLNDKSLANHLADNCKTLIEKYYSLETLIGEAEHILRYLVKN